MSHSIRKSSEQFGGGVRSYGILGNGVTESRWSLAAKWDDGMIVTVDLLKD